MFAPQEGGEWLEPGDPYEIEIRLVGKADSRFPYVFYALKSAAANGMGTGRGRMELTDVERWTSRGWLSVLGRGEVKEVEAGDLCADVPPAPGAVRIELLSPLRLKKNGRNVRPEQLDAATFLIALYRRTWMLAAAENPDSEVVEWKEIQHRAREVVLSDRNLRWREVVRRSARQGLMRAGGIVGAFTLDAGIEPFWPVLWAGQWLHVGHMACMGLGAYQLRSAKLGDRDPTGNGCKDGADEDESENT